MSISLVTRWTSACSVILRFSKILTATYSFIVNARFEKEMIWLAYLLACDVVGAEFDLAEGPLADILADGVVADRSVARRGLGWPTVFVYCCTGGCLFTYGRSFSLMLRICSLLWPVRATLAILMVLACFGAMLTRLSILLSWLGVVVCLLQLFKIIPTTVAVHFSLEVSSYIDLKLIFI